MPSAVVLVVWPKYGSHNSVAAVPETAKSIFEPD